MNSCRPGSWPAGSLCPVQGLPSEAGRKAKGSCSQRRLVEGRSQVSGTAAPQRLPTPAGQGHEAWRRESTGHPLKNCRGTVHSQAQSNGSPGQFGADPGVQKGCLDQETAAATAEHLLRAGPALRTSHPSFSPGKRPVSIPILEMRKLRFRDSGTYLRPCS